MKLKHGDNEFEINDELVGGILIGLFVVVIIAMILAAACFVGPNKKKEIEPISTSLTKENPK